MNWSDVFVMLYIGLIAFVSFMFIYLGIKYLSGGYMKNEVKVSSEELRRLKNIENKYVRLKRMYKTLRKDGTQSVIYAQYLFQEQRRKADKVRLNVVNRNTTKYTD